MNENELKEKLEEIAKGVKIFTTIINYDWSNEEKFYITKDQSDLVKSLFDLFKSLRWQIALNNYKELNVDNSEVIDTKKCGTPVKVRSCKEKHGDKTYFGILLGDVALHIGASIDSDDNLNIKHQMYNPAIFVPELNEIIYGCGSWWGEIESEEELNKLITSETIENVWYVKLLNGVLK